MPSVPNTVATAAAQRSTAPFTDIRIMIERCLRLSRRNLEVLTTSIITPIILMLMFVYLFGGAIQTGAQQYITYVVPGVLILCVSQSVSVTAVSVSQDLTTGIIDRLRSLDVSGAAVLAGHVVAGTARNVVATLLAFAVALLIGFRPTTVPPEWLGAVAMLLLFVFAISWVAAVIGLFARSPEAASGFAFFFFFLPYASSAMVPVRTMPSWIQGFAQHQPITPVTETIRSLLLGTAVGAYPLEAVIWCSGILLISVLLAGLLFQRRAA
jgi:ABC-2 type transport system permease protein